MSERRRILIVGAKFGELYLNAFMRGPPTSAHGSWELAGVLANGSTRARELAHAYGVPLFTEIETIPTDIDVACIVVRSTAVGGAGTRLAETMLARGMHVIQEHPVHPDEIARLQEQAAAQGRTYWVNSFYPCSTAGRAFIGLARRVRDLADIAPLFAEVTTSRQLLYSSLDLLLQATGDAADGIAPRKLESASRAFDTIELPLRGGTAHLRLQNYMDPDDPDLHSLVMHRLSLGWEAGYLSLEASHGPVTWTPTLHLGDHRDVARSLYRQAGSPEAAACFSMPTSIRLHDASPDWRTAFEIDGPAGVRWILGCLAARLAGETVPAGLSANHQLALSRLWQRVQQCAGAPGERPLVAPKPIEPSKLVIAETEFSS